MEPAPQCDATHSWADATEPAIPHAWCQAWQSSNRPEGAGQQLGSDVFHAYQTIVSVSTSVIRLLPRYGAARVCAQPMTCTLGLSQRVAVTLCHPHPHPPAVPQLYAHCGTHPWLTSRSHHNHPVVQRGPCSTTSVCHRLQTWLCGGQIKSLSTVVVHCPARGYVCMQVPGLDGFWTAWWRV